MPKLEALPEPTAEDFARMFKDADGPFVPDVSTSITVCSPCVGVTLQLMGLSHLAEYNRRLVVTNATHRLTLELPYDGDGARTNLYRTRDRRLLLLKDDSCVWITPEPLGASKCHLGELPLRKGVRINTSDCRAPWPARRRPQRWEPLVESDYIDGLFYVGAFHSDRGEVYPDFRLSLGWRFSTAEQEPEQVNTCNA